jgi:hypothetical protein
MTTIIMLAAVSCLVFSPIAAGAPQAAETNCFCRSQI